jgi:hypothetical protein
MDHPGPDDGTAPGECTRTPVPFPPRTGAWHDAPIVAILHPSVNGRINWRLVEGVPPEPSLRSRTAAWLAGPGGRIAAVFLGSRLLVFVGALAAEGLLRRNPNLTSGDGAPVLTSLTAWDGWWYLGIVRDGYHVAPLVTGYHDYAFYPLFPLLVDVLSWPFPGLAGLIAVLLSNVLFAVALVLLHRLTSEVLGGDRAERACILLCLFPFAFVFSMAYTESLFLVLSLGSLLAAERGRAAPAGMLAMVAGAARPTGVLLVVPLAMILWRRLGDRRRLAWLAVVPIGALLFMAYVGSLTGDPTAFGSAQAAWGRTGLDASPAGGNLVEHIDPARATTVLILLAYVFLFVFMRPDRVPLAYVMIPILFVGVAALSGSLESIGRYGMEAFPYAWVLAGRKGRLMRDGWPVLSAGLLLGLSAVAFAGWYVP